MGGAANSSSGNPNFSSAIAGGRETGTRNSGYVEIENGGGKQAKVGAKQERADWNKPKSDEEMDVLRQREEARRVDKEDDDLLRHFAELEREMEKEKKICIDDKAWKYS